MQQSCLGYLWLKGVDGDAARDLPNWTCSLCLLRGGKIVHFDIDPSTQPKGKIPLVDAQAEVSSGSVPGALYSATDCFKCVTPGRTFHIFAETHENRNKWVNLLTDHISRLSSDRASFERSNRENFELKAQISTAERVEFLTKSGGIKNFSWRKRLFVLNGEFFVYYELPQGLRARGNYECHTCKSVPSLPQDAPEDVNLDNLFQVESDFGNLMLGALDPNDKQRWMDALMSRGSGDTRIPAGDPVNMAGLSGDSAVIVTKLTEERDELQRQVTELTQLKERSDKIIRSLKNENKKLKQDVDDLVVQIKEKDHGIQQLSQTMERMRIEVMEAHDSGKK